MLCSSAIEGMASTDARCGLAELLVGDVPGEGDAVGDAQLAREMLQVALLVSAAHDLDLDVELGGEQRDRAQQHVDLLLPGHTADEDDAVLGARLPVREVVVRVDAARDRVHAAKAGEALEEVRGAPGGGGDRLGPPKVRRAAFPRARPPSPARPSGSGVNSSMFSGMKWLVPMRMPRFAASIDSPRPTTRWTGSGPRRA